MDPSLRLWLCGAAIVSLGALLPGCGRLGYEALVGVGVDASDNAPVIDGSVDLADLSSSRDLGSPPDQSSDSLNTRPDGGIAPCSGVIGKDECLAGTAQGVWHANGSAANEVAGSALKTKMHGSVPYGPGRDATAWQFRSQATGEMRDGNYIGASPMPAPVVSALTLDAWVQKTGFNAYVGSNRVVVGTDFKNAFESNQAMIYLHEADEFFFYVRVGSGGVRGVDWDTCWFKVSAFHVWARLTATFDGTSMIKCYVNGVQVDATRLTGNRAIPVTDFVIGRNFPGDVDEVRMFDRALDASEVAASWP